MFGDVAGMFTDTATVVRWDQRGCGRSERSAGPWTSERFVADLDAVRRHFGLERMALLGHSWGAQLALGYALAHPERVSALVYVSGTGIGPDSDWHDAYRRDFTARLGERPERLARFHELTERQPSGPGRRSGSWPSCSGRSSSRTASGRPGARRAHGRPLVRHQPRLQQGPQRRAEDQLGHPRSCTPPVGRWTCPWPSSTGHGTSGRARRWTHWCGPCRASGARSCRRPGTCPGWRTRRASGRRSPGHCERPAARSAVAARRGGSARRRSRRVAALVARQRSQLVRPGCQRQASAAKPPSPRRAP